MKKYTLMVLFCIGFAACRQDDKACLSVHFPDILDIKNVPAAQIDWTAFAFSDLGAWFGFALPDSGRHPGGFAGPFLHTQGQWMGPSVIGLQIRDVNTGLDVDWSAAEADLHSLPGRLHQSWLFWDFQVEMDLVFISNRSALIEIRLTGRSDCRLALSWRGSAFDAVFPAENSGAGWVVDLQGGDQARLTLPPDLSAVYTQKAGGKAYEIRLVDPVVLGENWTWTTAAAFSLNFHPSEWHGESAFLQTALKKPEETIAETTVRWSDYLNRSLNSHSPYASEPGYRKVAVKSLMTLVGNWKCARGDLLHDGFFPSASVGYFNGFWGWDTWKIAAAWARFAPEAAKNGIRAMFDYQNDAGMIADVIYTDSIENNWRDSKPPLAAWAVWSVYEQDGDRTFLEEMWPGLVAFHAWWYKDRDHDHNGLCEYGSTDGTVIAARWESGMDDGLRFDGTGMLKNSDGAWSMDQESVDLNSYLYMDKACLALIASALSMPEEAVSYREEASRLRKMIQSRFWDEEDGFFYDVRIEDSCFVRVKGPEGWVPLTWKIASQVQADQVAAHMLDTSQFATYLPMPTIPADHEKFMSGYWRGPVWLDQAGFGIRALHNYGYHEQAMAMTRQLFKRPAGLFDTGAPIHENYDPRDGRALKAPHFSWSAAHYLLMYWGW